MLYYILHLTWQLLQLIKQSQDFLQQSINKGKYLVTHQNNVIPSVIHGNTNEPLLLLITRMTETFTVSNWSDVKVFNLYDQKITYQ